MAIDEAASYTFSEQPAALAGPIRLPVSQICVLVFAAGFLLYALAPHAAHLDFSVPRGGEVVHVARSLARTGTFANPFDSFPTGPTAHVAPLYPFFYAGILRVWGEGFAAIALLWVLNLSFVAAQLALLPLLAERLGMGVVPGVLGAVVGMAFPVFHVDSSWEAGLSGLFLVILCLLVASFLATGGSLRGVLSLGSLSGLALLTQPTVLLPLLAWLLVYVLVRRGAGIGRSLALAGLVLGVSLLVCLPWIARNELLWGRLFFIRDDLGLELYTSNNPCARPSLVENIRSGCHAKTHPNFNPEIAQQVAAQGEYAFNRHDERKALSWIDANPRSFLRLTAERFVLFWFPAKDGGASALVVWGVTLVSLLGLYRLLRKNCLAAAVLGAVLVSFPGVYYLVQFDPRYRSPILWVSLLLAGYGIEEVSRALRVAQFWRPVGDGEPAASASKT